MDPRPSSLREIASVIAHHLRFLGRSFQGVWYNQALVLGILLAGGIGFCLSYQFRFDFDVPQVWSEQCFFLLPYAAGVKLALFFLLGGHLSGWRYVGLRDMVFIVFYCAICSLILASFSLLSLSAHVPRGVIAIDFLVSLVLVGGLRVSARLVREEIMAGIRAPRRSGSRRAVIVGAGDAGEMLLREIKRDPGAGYTVEGFFDDDPSKRGMSIHGVRVLGNLDDAAGYVREMEISSAIVAIPSATQAQLKRIRDLFRDSNTSLKTLPRLHEIIDRSSALSQLRDISITDLLGREEVRIDTRQVRDLICGKRVLVTGAGGSIGGELCRQIFYRNPERLVLLERSENSLFHLHRNLKSLYADGMNPILVPLLCDINDAAAIHRELEKHKPSLVFHAAAHKHVAMQEISAAECFRNNVGGTVTLAKACHQIGVERFLLISSDKAVNPTSVMGATKRVCEIYCQAMSRMGAARFMAVRFGNVLASEGSVVPIFMEQIEKGGPVTVTHPEARRYFMTISEAVTLVLQATALGQSGQIMLLDMGEPVKIVDLAHQLISLAGRSPDEIHIEFTGLKAGEKLFEQLQSDHESFVKTAHDKIRIYQEPINDPAEAGSAVEHALSELSSGAANAEVRRVLKLLVPEYRPDQEINESEFTGESAHDQGVSGSFTVIPV